MRQFLYRLRSLFGRAERERSLDAEIRQHLDLLTEEYESRGMSRDAATFAALRQFGGVEQIKERHRDEWTFAALEQWRKDARCAFRSLRKTPAFTAATVLILALGFAASATVFSWMRQIIFDPLPGASDVGQLVAVENFADAGKGPGAPLTSSFPDFIDYRDHLKLLQLAAVGQSVFAVGKGTATERVWCELVSGNFFDVLGLSPAAGRWLLPSEQTDVQNAHPVAIISHRYWKSHFRDQASALGAILWINRVPFSIVGIAPENFAGTQSGLAYDVWLPLTMYGEVTHTGTWMLEDRSTRNFKLFGRLRPGVSLAQARGEIAALARFMAGRNIEDRRVGATVLPLWRWHWGLSDLLLKPAMLVTGACVVLLLIACANVANLHLARTFVRHREFCVRLALGSSRVRLARLLLVESLLVALVGCAIGLWMACGLQGALAWLLPAIAVPRLAQPGIGLAVAGFALALALLVALAAGLAPALQASRANLNGVLKQGGRTGSAAPRMRRLLGILVVTEIALAVVALAGAALFFEAFRAARAMPTGFVPEGQVLAQFNLATAGYTQEQADAFCQRLSDAIRHYPGVSAVSYADTLPLGFYSGNWEELEVDGYQPTPGENMKVFRNLIGPKYFDTMQIPLVAGRDFGLQDDAKSPPVMIVSEEFVRRYVPQGIALGRRVHGWGRWFTIVGVVRDIKIHTVEEAPIPFFYIPIRQVYRPEYGLIIHVRTEGSADETIAAVRRAAAAIDPAIVMFDAKPMRENIAGSLYGERIAATMLSVLGGVGLALAAVGLYSVMAFSVALRVNEIGIRVALGARPADVLALVVGQGMRLAGLGLLLGAVVAAMLAEAAASAGASFRIGDFQIYLLAALIVGMFALASVTLPALRAMRMNPVMALRNE